MGRYEFLTAVVSMVTGTTMLVTIAYLYFNRSKPRSQTAHLPQETEDRLARIERAVDSIAIEVERISEAQRFSAKILAEGRRPAEALPAPDAQEGRSRG